MSSTLTCTGNPCYCGQHSALRGARGMTRDQLPTDPIDDDVQHAGSSGGWNARVADLPVPPTELDPGTPHAPQSSPVPAENPYSRPLLRTALIMALTSDGVGVRKDIGFTAHSVSVDNPSNQWVYVAGAARWVPPNTVGVMLPLLGGTMVGGYDIGVPPGLTAAALPGTPVEIRIVYWQAYQPPSPGASIGASGSVGAPFTRLASSDGAYALGTGIPNTDTIAQNPGVVLLTENFNLGFNGVTWDRLRTSTPTTDALGTNAGLVVTGQALVWNGATWDRLPGGDGVGYQATGAIAANGSVLPVAVVAGKRFRVLTCTVGCTVAAQMWMQQSVGGAVMGVVRVPANQSVPIPLAPRGVVTPVGSGVQVFTDTAGTVAVTITGQYE